MAKENQERTNDTIAYLRTHNMDRGELTSSVAERLDANRLGLLTSKRKYGRGFNPFKPLG